MLELQEPGGQSRSLTSTFLTDSWHNPWSALLVKIILGGLIRPVCCLWLILWRCFLDLNCPLLPLGGSWNYHPPVTLQPYFWVYCLSDTYWWFNFVYCLGYLFFFSFSNRNVIETHVNWNQLVKTDSFIEEKVLICFFLKCWQLTKPDMYYLEPKLLQYSDTQGIKRYDFLVCSLQNHT